MASQIKTQLLSKLHAVNCWVTRVLPLNILTEYVRTTCIKRFLSFLAKWHPSHSSSNLHQFALKYILWASAAGEIQSTHQRVLGHARAHIWGKGEVSLTFAGKSFFCAFHRLPLNPAKICHHTPLVWIKGSTMKVYLSLAGNVLLPGDSFK